MVTSGLSEREGELRAPAGLLCSGLKFVSSSSVLKEATRGLSSGEGKSLPPVKRVSGCWVGSTLRRAGGEREPVRKLPARTTHTRLGWGAVGMVGGQSG